MSNTRRRLRPKGANQIPICGACRRDSTHSVQLGEGTAHSFEACDLHWVALVDAMHEAGLAVSVHACTDEGCLR